MKFLGKIENRILTIYDQDGYNQHLASLDGKISIDIKPLGKDRTLLQNNYYWLYLKVIADETGEDPDSLHHLFKNKFLLPTSKVVMGEEVVIPPTTTKQSKKDFTEYIERISAFCEIPPPDTELYLYN